MIFGDDMKDSMNVYTDFFKNISNNLKYYFGIIFFVTIVSSAYNVLFSIYLKNLGFNEAFVGQILSINTLGVALGAIPVAIFADRLNKKTTVILGLILMIVSNLIVLNIQVPIIMQVFAFIFGIGNATIMVLQAPIIFENTLKADRVTAFSMSFVLMNAAFVIGSLSLGYLSQILAEVSGATMANRLVLNGANLLIGIGIFLAFKFNGKQMQECRREESVFKTLQNLLNGYKKLSSGKTLLYLVQVSLIGLGAGMVIPFFSMYLKYSLNINDGIVGTIMAISQVGTVIGGLIVPPLAKRLGSVRTVLICQLLSIPFLLSISFPQGIVIMTISFFFRSSLMNMASPILGSMAMEIVADDARTYMSSMISMVSNLFRALGIYIGGVLMFRFSYNTPYYFTILCYLIGTFILYRVFKEVGRHRNDTENSVSE